MKKTGITTLKTRKTQPMLFRRVRARLDRNVAQLFRKRRTVRFFVHFKTNLYGLTMALLGFNQRQVICTTINIDYNKVLGQAEFKTLSSKP